MKPKEKKIPEAEFVANRTRREAASKEVDAARAELAGLLVRGQRDGLDVAGMSRLAGISRETAHKLLRGKGGRRA
jgi:hypothetical protein